MAYTATDTSLKAARESAAKANLIRDKVYDELRKYPCGATADQIANDINETIYNVRSRMTELKDQELAEDSGRRGKSAFGKTAIIWLAKARKDEK
jgi:predicted ArsR family transcriptional regulator